MESFKRILFDFWKEHIFSSHFQSTEFKSIAASIDVDVKFVVALMLPIPNDVALNIVAVFVAASIYVAASVTRLADFWKVTGANFLSKVAQLFCHFRQYEKIPLF